MIKAIGFIQSPFKEKMATPRQPGLAPSITQKLIFHSPYDRPECFTGLEVGQMVWVMFFFHLNPPNEDFRPMVRPPRFGGNKKIGVFATRSPFRPNPIGLSAVKIISIDIDQNKKISLEVAGGDFVDETPIIDIRPYLPYADAHPDAPTAYPTPKILPIKIHWDAHADLVLRDTDKIQLNEIVQLEFGPAYKEPTPGSCFKFLFKEWNIQVQVIKLGNPLELKISIIEKSNEKNKLGQQNNSTDDHF